MYGNRKGWRTLDLTITAGGHQMAKTKINLVWLKRDLRLEDHAPLAAAAEAGLPTLIFYTFEPSQLQEAHQDARHARFIVQSLTDLAQQLEQHAIQLLVFWSEIQPLLQQLREDFTLVTLFSHQETGLAASFARDQQLALWCRQQGVDWQELAQHPVQRGPQGRQQWRRQAKAFWGAPQASVNWASWSPLRLGPEHQAWSLKCQRLPRAWLTPVADQQMGGSQRAQAHLRHFLNEELPFYRQHIGSSNQERRSTSRLSAYLAYGNLSVRQVIQQLTAQAPSRPQSRFYTRLAWQGHFMQKFESDWRIEQEALNPAVGALWQARQAELDPSEQDRRWQAWSTGQTGFPLVDAGMRALIQTGFVSFRLRALLVSFACHHLELDWRAVALHLARLFLDFEPGIHYPQIQMQVGLTGFNTLRIYNPVEQPRHKEAQAAFIQRWVPELSPLPWPLLHQPWQLTPLEKQFYPKLDYPEPIIDSQASGRAARERLWSWQRSAPVQVWVPRLLATQVEAPGRLRASR